MPRQRRSGGFALLAQKVIKNHAARTAAAQYPASDQQAQETAFLVAAFPLCRTVEQALDDLCSGATASLDARGFE